MWRTEAWNNADDARQAESLSLLFRQLERRMGGNQTDSSFAHEIFESYANGCIIRFRSRRRAGCSGPHNSTKTSENNFRAVQNAPEIHGIPCPCSCVARGQWKFIAHSAPESIPHTTAQAKNCGRVSLLRELRKICTWNFSYVIYQQKHTRRQTLTHTQTHTAQQNCK